MPPPSATSQKSCDVRSIRDFHPATATSPPSPPCPPVCGKNFPGDQTVKAVDDPAGNLVGNSVLFPMRGRPDSGGQFQLVNLAHHKVIGGKLAGQGARRRVVYVIFVEITDQKTGIAINHHSRSSKIRRARFVLTRDPSGGMSFNS